MAGPLSDLAAGRCADLTDADVAFADRGRRLQLRGLAGEMRSARSALGSSSPKRRTAWPVGRISTVTPRSWSCRIAPGLGRRRPSAPVPTTRWSGSSSSTSTRSRTNAWPSLAPPVPHHPVGQDNDIPGLLASVDDDPVRTRSGRCVPSHRPQRDPVARRLSCGSARFSSWTRVPRRCCWRVSRGSAGPSASRGSRTHPSHEPREQLYAPPFPQVTPDRQGQSYQFSFRQVSAPSAPNL
jgi:hypothetical protein